MQDKIWITAKGEHIPVSKMGTDHIHRCIARIKRKNWRREYLERLELELRIRRIRGHA